MEGNGWLVSWCIGHLAGLAEPAAYNPALPDGLTQGQELAVEAVQMKGGTTPPKHYTEDTILASMESAGVEDMPENAERKGIAAMVKELVGTYQPVPGAAGMSLRTKKAFSAETGSAALRCGRIANSSAPSGKSSPT